MKYNIFKGLLACGALAVFAACSENAWNDEYLDGFEVPPAYSTVQTLEYTLTASDYSNIALTSKNPCLAVASSSVLKAIGTNQYFPSQSEAQKILPAYMDSILFPYFAATNGSSINLTYNVAATQSALATSIAAGQIYALTNDNYKTVWGGTNYTNAFTPAKPAASYLPSILKSQFPNAVSGDYVLATYNVATEEPEFGEGATAINKVAVGDEVTVEGYVTGVTTRGFILTDDTGSLLVYISSGFTPANYQLGSQVTVTGKASQYNGGLQLAPSSDVVTVGSKPYTFGTPTVVDDSNVATYAQEFVSAKSASKGLTAFYAETTATVSVSGNYINLVYSSASVQGSAYYVTDETKAIFTENNGKEVTIKGWAFSGAAKYLYFVVTEINGTAVTATAANNPYNPGPASITSTKSCSLYTYNGSTWSAATSVITLTQSDCNTMTGSTYGNLQSTQPQTYIPTYLKQHYPYANSGDVKYVVYQYYASSKTSLRCSEFTYNGSEWVMSTVSTVTEQYVRVNNSWIFNPNVTLVIPANKSEPGLTFYQITVDWVSANEGSGYIDRSNSEFYSGCSAYYGNVNHSISQVQKYASAMYPTCTAEVVIPLMRERFLYETMPATLKQYYPKADLIDGYNDPIIYEIDYITYYGSDKYDGKTGSVNDTVKYQVTGPGEFKLVYSTWKGGAVNE